MYERLIINDLDIITYVTSAPTENKKLLRQTGSELCRYLMTTSSVVVYKGIIVSEIKNAYMKKDDRDFDNFDYYIRKAITSKKNKLWELPNRRIVMSIKSMRPLLYFCHSYVYKRSYFRETYGKKVLAEYSDTVRYLYNYLSSALCTVEASDEFFESLPFPIEDSMYLFDMIYEELLDKHADRDTTDLTVINKSGSF